MGLSTPRMMERRPCHTTRPEERTPATELNETVLGLRWVFPGPAGKVTRAETRRTTIGRGSDCDVVLPGSEVSRHHAELVQIGSDWVIRDLNSRNGLFVNGRRVPHEALQPGYVVRVGEWVGIVRQVPLDPAHEVAFGEVAPGIFGSSRLAVELNRTRTAAASDLRIILEGEPGTGKECIARAIHRWSDRRGPFIGVNCAALPALLAEGELFGYRKGAFTGADRASLGHFRSAHGGTLLLDEITDLPYPLQSMLLRALEERAVTPLGESVPVPVDVRVIAATQEPLREAVAQKRFRGDLWGRLDGLTIRVPPLRERSEDCPGLLARVLTRGEAGYTHALDPRLIEALCLYGWPSNVRELYQVAHQLSVLHGSARVLRRSYLPERMLEERRTGPAEACSGTQNLASDESAPKAEDAPRALAEAIRASQGNFARAARELGISRQKAYRLLDELPEEERSVLRDAGKRRRGGRA